MELLLRLSNVYYHIVDFNLPNIAFFFINLWIFCCRNSMFEGVTIYYQFFFLIIFQSLIRMNSKYEIFEFQWRYYLQASIVN